MRKTAGPKSPAQASPHGTAIGTLAGLGGDTNNPYGCARSAGAATLPTICGAGPAIGFAAILNASITIAVRKGTQGQDAFAIHTAASTPGVARPKEALVTTGIAIVRGAKRGLAPIGDCPVTIIKAQFTGSYSACTLAAHHIGVGQCAGLIAGTTMGGIHPGVDLATAHHITVAIFEAGVALGGASPLDAVDRAIRVRLCRAIIIAGPAMEFRVEIGLTAIIGF